MFEIELLNNNLTFKTEEGLFSPGGPDRGTLAMLRNVEIGTEDKVLDLGCGYGLVGVAVAKKIGEDRVYMVDIDEKAVEASRVNAALNDVGNVMIVQGFGLDPFDNIDFTMILSNPPYHTDFSVSKAFIEKGFRSLAVGGRMVMVVKRLDWYRNKLTSVFGGVKVIEDDGYYVLTAEKRGQRVIKQKNKQTTKKHEKKMFGKKLR